MSTGPRPVKLCLDQQMFTQQQRRMPTQIRTQPTNHHRKPWFDSWSDFSDSDDEYYDDEYEESSVETAKQSILRGTNINAGAINAHSMVANSVKADMIDVPTNQTKAFYDGLLVEFGFELAFFFVAV
jgi:hypothetical protein